MKSNIMTVTKNTERLDQINVGSAAMRKRIGTTVYEVAIHFDHDAKETMNEKILRLIENDLNLTVSGAMLYLPQSGKAPGRSPI